MIEREIFQIIDAGITLLKTKPGVVSKFFQRSAIGMAKAECDKVETLLRTGALHVQHGYPRRGIEFPAFCITLGSDSEDQMFLGDEGGVIGADDLDEPENAGADQFGAVFGQTLNILVYTLHPDHTLYCYHLLKQILINGLPQLKADPWNLIGLRISGADMAPDKSFEPAVPFVRRVTLSYQYQYTQTWPQTRVGKIKKVSGIHVDERGDEGADVGGVQTLVTAKDR